MTVACTFEPFSAAAPRKNKFVHASHICGRVCYCAFCLFRVLVVCVEVLVQSRANFRVCAVCVCSVSWALCVLPCASVLFKYHPLVVTLVCQLLRASRVSGWCAFPCSLIFL